MRRSLIAVLLLGAAGLAWWLGSPLFIRTYADEALPVAAPARPAAVSPGAPLPSGAAPAPAPRTLKSGALQFVDSAHHGEGEVRIVETMDLRVVRFENVAISNAPDVQIYLSSDTGGRYVPANSVHLGALKATDGSFNYEILAGLDVSSYRSVIAWCRAFNVLVTWAPLA